jgi:hypothetical protein
MRSLGTLSILTRRCVNPNAERLVFGSVSFTAARSVVLSVITGGGKWLMIKAHADPLYQHLIVTAERKFWRCVESGETPRRAPRGASILVLTARQVGKTTPAAECGGGATGP